MNINDFLRPADAIIEQRPLDKTQLLKDLSRRAAEVLGLSPEQVADSIQKREKLGSTGVGGGVAVPHARLASLKKPFGLFARLRRPIDFDAVDGRPVDVVFLLLAPAAPEGDQLNALACVTRKLRDPTVVADLRQATDGPAMYRVLTAGCEQAAPSPPPT